MKIIDKAALSTPRSPFCEYCLRSCRNPTERHHIVARGLGGGSRMDIPENLIDLGECWDCGCHQKAQAGKISKAVLWERVAAREGTTVRKILNLIARLQGKFVRSARQQPWHRRRKIK